MPPPIHHLNEIVDKSTQNTIINLLFYFRYHENYDANVSHVNKNDWCFLYLYFFPHGFQSCDILKQHNSMWMQCLIYLYAKNISN